MKINFTKKEYRLFLDLAYLGQWMMDAHNESTEPFGDEYELLLQKMYAYAEQMECNDLIEFDDR